MEMSRCFFHENEIKSIFYGWRALFFKLNKPMALKLRSLQEQSRFSIEYRQSSMKTLISLNSCVKCEPKRKSIKQNKEKY